MPALSVVKSASCVPLETRAPPAHHAFLAVRLVAKHQRIAAITLAIARFGAHQKCPCRLGEGSGSCYACSPYLPPMVWAVLNSDDPRHPLATAMLPVTDRSLQRFREATARMLLLWLNGVLERLMSPRRTHPLSQRRVFQDATSHGRSHDADAEPAARVWGHPIPTIEKPGRCQSRSSSSGTT